MAKISLIVAQSENRVIGREGKLPWNLPEDLKRFKAITSGHPVVMGRKTYESIGRLLPKRTNVIITRSKDYRVAGAEIAHSLKEALALAAEAPGGEEIFVIGGGEIFSEVLPQAERIYLTEVHANIEGDAYFPPVPPNFREKGRENRPPQAGEPGFSFVLLEKV